MGEGDSEISTVCGTRPWERGTVGCPWYVAPIRGGEGTWHPSMGEGDSGMSMVCMTMGWER